MRSKLPACFVICTLFAALPALAQLDSSKLHAKFGEPLSRETFHMPSGFDLVVDYGANRQVCKLEVPALMPTDENPANSTVMSQRMYAFLADLVPGSLRGKEVNRHAMVMGAMSVVSIEYEHVTVAELQHAGEPFGRNTITVTFKNEGCR